METTGRARWFRYGVALTAFLVAWPNHALAPASFRIALYNGRPPVVAAAILAGLLALAVSSPERLRSTIRDHRTPLILGLAFTGLVALLSAWRGTFSAPGVALFTLWPLAAFVLAPACVDDERDLMALARSLFWAFAATWAIASLLTLAGDIRTAVAGLKETGFWLLVGEGAPYGFMNGNYFAQSLSLMLAIAWLLYSHTETSDSERRRLLLITLITCAALYFTKARGVGLGTFAFFAVIAYLRGRRRFWLGLGAVALIGSLGFWLAASTFTELDQAGTGRLRYWSYASGALLESESPVSALMFGPEEVRHYTGVSGYDPLAGSKEYRKISVDNNYLELLLQAGLIGTTLFLGAHVALFRRADTSGLVGAWGLALLVTIAVNGMFASMLPTFNAPIGIVCAACLAPAARLARRRHEDAERSPAGTRPSSRWVLQRGLE